MTNNGYFNWQETYHQLHKGFSKNKEKPLIGITGNFGEKGCELAEGYYESVQKAGGIPMIIPPTDNNQQLADILDRIDGLVLSGGGDLNPLFLDEDPIKELRTVNYKRDLMELLLTKMAADRQVPILGICRGIQILAAALGGKLYQDIYKQNDKPLIKHSQELDRRFASHWISITPHSLLAKIMNSERIAVNSFHHQAVADPGPAFQIAAQSADGIIEAIESTEYKSIIGVQWHPECFILNQDQTMMPLFEWLTAEAISFHEAKKIHQNILTLDSHCDTPMFFHKNIRFDHRDPNILVDLHKMDEGKLDATIMVAYLEQKERDEQSLLAAKQKADSLLDQIEVLVSLNKHAVDLAYTPDDLYKLKKKGKKAIMLGIENGYAIGRDLKNLQHFADRGIVYMTLCHNGDNDICDSARGNGEHHGVSLFGEQVIQDMNHLGILVDLSHASEESFYDALEISKTPIVCSHSSCKALCNVPRNLSDEQLRKLAHNGGVAQVTLYHGFLREAGEATIRDAVAHLEHMIRIMGIEHVGIGTDFDGDGGIKGCASASEVINFTRALLQKRYSEADLRLIWGENFLNVMRQAQQIRNQAI